MIPAAFEYYAPSTVAEAVRLLQQNDEAKILAGGHSLLPALKLRLTQPTALIDITKIADLKRVSVDGGRVTVGAAATYHEVASNEAVRGACPVLAECVAQIGDIQVRNRGTLVGALAHADPAADLPAVALALGATMTAQGPGGTREIAADDMFIEMLTTALEPSEVLTAVSFPALGAGEGGAYAKLRHPASRYAIVGVAAYVKLGAGGTVEAARVAVTGAGPKAVRQPTVEAALVGSSGDEAAVAAAAAQAGEDMDYLGDIHASEEYRRAMVKVYTKRALAEALAHARG